MLTTQVPLSLRRGLTVAVGVSTVTFALSAPAVATGDGAATPPPAAAGASAEPIGGERLADPGIVVGSGTAVAALPTVRSATWIVADADTGAVLAARGAHVQRAPASTLKTLTALTLIPQLDPAAQYRVTDADVRVDGSKVGLMTGQTYTNEQLFTALFLPSANDAAGALARSNGGVKETVAQMNATAERLQAHDTVAMNPSGLDADGQLSSAYDLALIARAGLYDQQFRAYCSLQSAKFPGKPLAHGKRATFQIQNQNPLLGRYKGALGIKNGFTTNAGRTFIGAAERNGRTLIVTLMGIEEPTASAAGNLLSWGFANAPRIDQPVGVLAEPVAADAPQPADDIAAAGLTTSTDGGASRWLAYSLATIAVLAGAALIGLAVFNNEALTRRRIRRRYR